MLFSLNFVYIMVECAVVEARSKQGGVPKVVERWGDPDASRCVLAASIDDCKSDPVCCKFVVREI